MKKRKNNLIYSPLHGWNTSKEQPIKKKIKISGKIHSIEGREVQASNQEEIPLNEPEYTRISRIYFDNYEH